MKFNPNSLPSSTNVRFVILGATVTFMAMWYGNRLPETLRFINNYPAPLSLTSALSLTGLVWSVALLLYLIHPLFAGRGFRQGRDVQGAAAFVELVETTCHQLGLRRPVVVVNDDISDLEAKAYGLPFFRRIAFGKRNILLCAKSPDVFRAKLTHEIGHIINNDVDIAYISQALVRTSYFFLVAVAAYWFSNFFRDPPISGFFLSVLTSGGLSIIASAMFWFGLIFLENREFVRQREFMADAEAAFRISPEYIALALGTDSSVGTGRNLSSVFSLHPSVRSRLHSLSNYSIAGFPDWKLMVITGYLLSVYESVAATVAGKYAADDRVTSWTYQNSQSIDELFSIFKADLAYFYITALTALTMQVIFIFIVSTTMRAGIQARLCDMKFKVYACYTVLSTLSFCVGYYIGDKIDPFYISNLFASRFNHIDVDFANVGVEGLFNHGAVIFISMLCYYGLGRYVTYGRRSKKVSQTTWFLVATIHTYAVAQLTILSYIVLQILVAGPSRTLENNEWGGVVGAFAGLAIGWLLAIASLFLIRNGFTLRGKREGVTSLSPWFSGSVQ